MEWNATWNDPLRTYLALYHELVGDKSQEGKGLAKYRWPEDRNLTWTGQLVAELCSQFTEKTADEQH